MLVLSLSSPKTRDQQIGDFTLRYIFALERAAEVVDRFGQRPGHGPEVSLARDAVVSRQPLRARDS